ncbi:hypothetical protein [Paraliomyxa miuraensis]|uniref:hypothetical protein n=1 Tax=Paraliomyxa miuraensis TaxID=376150 RepID=UPI00224F9979|nr:hypothetical protein [Paraliomyxa miuraensis]MCX4240816.1 hypothetical protein [Paraliomyxa miuraensis]
MRAPIVTGLLSMGLAGLASGCGTADEGRSSAESGPADGPVTLTIGEDGPEPTDDGPGTTTGTGGGSGSATTATTTGVDDTTGPGVLFDLGDAPDVGGPMTYPVRMLPGLVSITFYERTGGAAPDAFTFTVDGPELTVRLADPLSVGNFDIDGATGEFYDVYYSDQDGNFELDGRYLTISGTFGQALPAGGGLNLAEIGLDFEDATTEFGNYVASHVILGDNAAQPDGNVDNAIDGDLQTHTTMGNTVGTNERLRVTLGFLSSSGPPG